MLDASYFGQACLSPRITCDHRFIRFRRWIGDDGSNAGPHNLPLVLAGLCRDPA